MWNLVILVQDDFLFSFSISFFFPALLCSWYLFYLGFLRVSIFVCSFLDTISLILDLD